MTDLNEIQSSEIVRITGSDPSGLEQTPVQSTASGALQTNLRNNSGTEVGTSSNPIRTDPTGTTTQPVSATSLPLPTGAANATKQDIIIANLQAINSLVPTIHDYISLGYTGTDLTTVVFKLGGSSGTTVSTLTLGYTSGNLTSVTKT